MKKVLLMSLLCLWGVGMQGADTSILDFGAHQNSADNTKAIQALYLHGGSILKGVTDPKA